MCVVKTISMMKTRRDHPNSTKNPRKWKNKTKEGREWKKREILAPTRTDLTWTAPTFSGTAPTLTTPARTAPHLYPGPQTTRQPTPPWWNTGGRTSWTQKVFFLNFVVHGRVFRVEIRFFTRWVPFLQLSAVLSSCT